MHIQLRKAIDAMNNNTLPATPHRSSTAASATAAENESQPLEE